MSKRGMRGGLWVKLRVGAPELQITGEPIMGAKDRMFFQRIVNELLTKERAPTKKGAV